MRLEVGKYYETRKGLKALTLYIGLKSENGYDSDGTVALLIFKDDGRTKLTTCFHNGNYMRENGTKQDDFDLVREWEEPSLVFFPVLKNGPSSDTRTTYEEAMNLGAILASEENPLIGVVEVNQNRLKTKMIRSGDIQLPVSNQTEEPEETEVSDASDQE